MNARERVESYLKEGYRLVFWPAVGDAKGPREPDWPERNYTLDHFHDHYRVGMITGHEIAPGRFVHDVDLDWAEGASVAARLLPPTDFVFGRQSKPLSHCCYTAPVPIPSTRYEDIDRTCLIELRGTTRDGKPGMQTMIPPSVWSKDGRKEPLVFKREGVPSHYETAALIHAVKLSAIAMILARNLGRNGFGHEVRLAWAGCLLNLGYEVEDLVRMGEAISIFCTNTEVNDVRVAVESTAKRLADANLKNKGARALAKALGEKGKLIVQRIREWSGQHNDFVRNGDGSILRDHADNIRRALDLMGVELSHNTFSDKLLIDQNGERRPLEDSEMTKLWMRIDSEFAFRPTLMYFEKCLQFFAWTNPFHPVKDYLDGLTWDGTPRLDTWLIDTAGASDTPYTRAVSALVLIAAVRRIRQPGAKFDEIVVLESGQGMEKSSALRALCHDPDWFSDDLPLNLSSQQMIERTLGKWIIEAADLAGKRKAEIEQLKAMLSRQVDGPARMAYAHFAVERPRQFILFGTTNSTAYLTDPTGARRFWPVLISRFNVAKVKALRDQLWAEASAREKLGEAIRLHEGLWADASLEQENRREVDPWEPSLRAYLSRVPVKNGVRVVTTTALWEVLRIDLAERDRAGQVRLSDIMQRLQFSRVKVRVGRELTVGFRGPAVLPDVITPGVVDEADETPDLLM